MERAEQPNLHGGRVDGSFGVLVRQGAATVRLPSGLTPL